MPRLRDVLLGREDSEARAAARVFLFEREGA